MATSKQARLREFSQAARKKIRERDGGKCIFCEMNYHMEKITWMGQQITGIMHYIPRSHNGLGIPQNGAIGCQYHHEMLDNGYEGRREEMLGLFREYLRSYYPGWDEKELVYDKWSGMKNR